jgi:hypothetical protein
MSLIRVNERLAFGTSRLINLETALISTAFDLIAKNRTVKLCVSQPVSRVLYGQRCFQRQRGGHSSWALVTKHLQQPTRTTGRKSRVRLPSRAAPIWSCSRWGLPCRFCCQLRGALLPHRFTLTHVACAEASRLERFIFCGTVPGVAPAGN